MLKGPVLLVTYPVKHRDVTELLNRQKYIINLYLRSVESKTQKGKKNLQWVQVPYHYIET